MNDVYILGGGRTDFKRNLKKEGKTIRDLITESGRKAIDDAKIDPAEIEAAVSIIIAETDPRKQTSQ
jgi:acetyl-CoA C-acetyltransferase